MTSAAAPAVSWRHASCSASYVAGQDPADPCAVLDRHERGPQRRPANRLLRRAGELDAVGVRAPPTGAVLAWALADLDDQPNHRQRRREERRTVCEAPVDSFGDGGLGANDLDDDASRVVRGGMPAAEA